MVWLQKRNEFLSQISEKELKQHYKREKNAKAKLRLLAAIQRKQGKTLDDIAFSLQKPKMTISDWLRRLVQHGLKGIYDIKQPGKPARLTPNQLKKLETILERSPQKQGLPFCVWTTKLVQYIIIELFNVKYEVRNVREIIHKLNFRFRVPRPENKKANKNLQEKFKKNLKKKYNIIINLDLRSSALMKFTTS